MIEPVRTQALTKRYGDLVAVDDLELTVRALGGLRVPRPQRRRQDHDAADAAGADPARRRAACACSATRSAGRRWPKVGALIEGPAFYPYLSGRDNLRVLARHAGVDRRGSPPCSTRWS